MIPENREIDKRLGWLLPKQRALTAMDETAILIKKADSVSANRHDQSLSSKRKGASIGQPCQAKR